MKKYWKFIAIIVVIVLSIGTFYVKSAKSEEQYPEFVIQKISGDEDEVKPLVLDGSYSDMNYLNKNVKISADGSTYTSNSFLDQIIGQPPIEIKELQDKYHTFMRGKGSQVNLFFEDEKVLAYADVDYNFGSSSSREFKFTISVLNKEDDSADSFTLEIPDGEKLEYVYMEDVQMVKDELYLITQNSMRKNDKYNEEKQIYTIDVANQKISSHDPIIQNSNGQDDTHFNTQLIRSSPTKANENVVMINTEIKVIEDTESYMEEVVNQEFLSYNIATKEIKKLDLPDLHLDNSELSLLDGSTVYFITFEGQGLLVTPYSLVDDQVGESYRIKLSVEEEVVPATMTTVKDGKLYIASQQLSPKLKITHADVIVVDLKTGDTLFKGEIALNDPKVSDDYDLYLYEMYVN